MCPPASSMGRLGYGYSERSGEAADELKSALEIGVPFAIAHVAALATEFEALVHLPPLQR